jgi:hypothetical protein
MGVYTQRYFVTNFSYLFGYSVALRACCARWCGGEVARGLVKGLGCKFIPACKYSAWSESHVES